MAGSPWQFTLLPDSISTVTITDGSTTVTVNRGSGKTGDAFLTGAFTETTIVTISAEGYNDLTNVTVGDTNLVMIPASSKPSNLYPYTDPNANSTPKTLYTDSTTLTTGLVLYDNTGTDTGYKVGTVSGNSFDILATRKIIWQNTDITHDYGTSITINNETLNCHDMYQLSSYTWIVPVGEDVRIVFNGAENGYSGHISSSSDIDYIPAGDSTYWGPVDYTNTIDFVMPDKDLTFSITDEMD